MSVDAEQYTRLALENVHENNYENAISNFHEALKCAQFAQDSYDAKLFCRCKLNLGAAIVASSTTSEGLKYLESVQPQEHDHQLAGDVCYNMCSAHEHLNNAAEAIVCIQRAIEHYNKCLDGAVPKADSTHRLASLYAKLQEFEKAAEAYADAASLYKTTGNVHQHAACLLQQAHLFQRCNQDADVAAVANECAKLCTEQPTAGLSTYTKTEKVLLLY